MAFDVTSKYLGSSLKKKHEINIANILKRDCGIESMLLLEKRLLFLIEQGSKQEEVSSDVLIVIIEAKPQVLSAIITLEEGSETERNS